MPDYELRPDNWRAWPAELFDREDPEPDEQFYLEPRKVVHIDLYAIQAVSDLYRELVPPNSAMSWRRFTARFLPCFRPRDSILRYDRRLLRCGISQVPAAPTSA